MNEFTLRINYLLFPWFYKNVDDHFKQWTFFKSVKLLIQNYRHCRFREKQNEDLISRAIKREDQLNSEISRMRMMQIATGDQIESLNSMFGTDFKKPTDN